MLQGTGLALLIAELLGGALFDAKVGEAGAHGEAQALVSKTGRVRGEDPAFLGVELEARRLLQVGAVRQAIRVQLLSRLQGWHPQGRQAAA